MKKLVPVLIVSTIVVAIFSYGPSRNFVFERARYGTGVKEQPKPKIFAKAGYEIRMKWEGNFLGGMCKTQVIFTKAPGKVYEYIDAGRERIGRVSFLDKDNYQVIDDYCDNDNFTVEKKDAGETLIYRHNFQCSADDYNKICEARYSLDSSAREEDLSR